MYLPSPWPHRHHEPRRSGCYAVDPGYAVDWGVYHPSSTPLRVRRGFLPGIAGGNLEPPRTPVLGSPRPLPDSTPPGGTGRTNDRGGARTTVPAVARDRGTYTRQGPRRARDCGSRGRAASADPVNQLAAEQSTGSGRTGWFSPSPELGQLSAQRGIWPGSGSAAANACSLGRGTPPEPGARGLPARPRSSYR